jgi:Zn-dependent alcohol dehydrogenase
MKTRAAVAFAAGKPLEIMEVGLEGSRAGEVLVEIEATGIANSDAILGPRRPSIRSSIRRRSTC